MVTASHSRPAMTTANQHDQPASMGRHQHARPASHQHHARQVRTGGRTYARKYRVSREQNTYKAKGNMGIIEKTSILREQMILKKI